MLYPVTKITKNKIKNTDFKVSNPTIFEILSDNVKFEFLVSYKASDSAILCGTGNAHREKYPLPIFVRHSWTSDFKQTSIFYADPTLYLNDLTLTWYYGTNKRWYLEEIADLLKMILDRLDIKNENTLCFGSSGGGYSSIILATMLRSKATVINPQCNVLNYNKQYLNQFKESVLSPEEKLIEERLNTIDVIKHYNYMPYIHYIQNVKCKYDLRDQLYPFLRELDESNFYCTDKLCVDFYSDLGGHNAMPSKSYCLNVIEKDFNTNLTINSSLYLSNGYKLMINGIGINSITSYSAKTKTLSIDIIHDEKLCNCRYAFYLVDSNNATVEKRGYSTQHHSEFTIHKNGKYRIKFFVSVNSLKHSSYSDIIECLD